MKNLLIKLSLFTLPFFSLNTNAQLMSWNDNYYSEIKIEKNDLHYTIIDEVYDSMQNKYTLYNVNEDKNTLYLHKSTIENTILWEFSIASFKEENFIPNGLYLDLDNNIFLTVFKKNKLNDSSIIYRLNEDGEFISEISFR